MTGIVSSRRARRVLAGSSAVLNALTAGSIFTYPLWAPPLARALSLTSAQMSALAVCAILGEYLSASFWGHVADVRGPGTISLIAAVLFGAAYTLLGWRYSVSVSSGDEPVPPTQWLFFSFYYALAGCATSASYFSAVLWFSTSFPPKHAGLAIGIPCSIFGLSPLFLSSLARFFTTGDDAAEDGSAVTLLAGELDPSRWLLFLAGLLFAVNILGAICIKVVPWDEDEPERPLPGSLDDDTTRADADEDSVTERTRLLNTDRSYSAHRHHHHHHHHGRGEHAGESLYATLAKPTFWLLGAVILLGSGPCEMTMSVIGAIVESLLAGQSSIARGTPRRALAVRTTHVQVLSAANTVSRLLCGALSDWLSYSAAAHAHDEDGVSTATASVSSASSVSSVSDDDKTWHAKLRARFADPPRVSRLAFLTTTCIVLVLTFLYTSFVLDQESGLFVLSVLVGTCYGVIFTLSPSIVRTVWPVKNFGRTWGLLSLFSAIGALIFTPLYGLMSDLAKRQQDSDDSDICRGRACWQPTFLCAALSALVACALTVLLWRHWWRGKV